MGGTAALALSGVGMLASQMKSASPKPQAAQKYQAQVADIQRRQAADAKTRKDALARASARQRARFASQGINPADGSSAAIIEGLQNKTTQELADKAATYNAQLERAQSTFSDAQALNLEKRSSRFDLLLDSNNTLLQFQNWS